MTSGSRLTYGVITSQCYWARFLSCCTETRRLEALRIQREQEAEERRQLAEKEQCEEEASIQEAHRLEEGWCVCEQLAREEGKASSAAAP